MSKNDADSLVNVLETAPVVPADVWHMLLTGLDPFSVFGTMIYGALGTERKAIILFKELAMLLSVALALTPAFKMKFWNLGGEGQALAGALASAACMILMKDMRQTTSSTAAADPTRKAEWLRRFRHRLQHRHQAPLERVQQGVQA